MISKCANPACSTAFHYLRDGRLFRMETPYEGPSASEPLDFREGKPVRRVEHFWLCGKCAASLTLIVDRGKVVTVPLRVQAAAS